MNLHTKALAATKDHVRSTRWGQERRLEFVDFRLRWEGRLNRGDLMEFFGISVPQASLDIARYLELAPGNAFYDKSVRMYVAGSAFAPLFPANEPERYLGELLAREMRIVPSELSFLGWAPPVGLMPRPGRVMRAEVLLRLLAAVRSQSALRVVYQSMSSPEPRERVIVPHAFGHDGMRWHVRAYCYTRRKYLDFLFGRILQANRTDEPGRDGTDDEAWHRLVPIVLAPHPELTEGQKRAIKLDYGMLDGTATLECRQALLFYALRSLRLLKEGVESAQEQQLTLVNRADIAPLLPWAVSAK